MKPKNKLWLINSALLILFLIGEYGICGAQVFKAINTPLIVKPALVLPAGETTQTVETSVNNAEQQATIKTQQNTVNQLEINRQARIAAEKNTPNKGSSSFESFISEYWVQFLALIVSLIGVALAVTGFTLAGAKKKKSVSKFINQIDDTFASFKWKSKRCEAELYRLHDLIDEQLKAGKIDEGSYHLLNSRIDKYLAEIKEIDRLPPHLKEKV